jgi:hypothetical protein
MLSTILVIVLILILIGALPRWPHSTNWGYGPGGIVGVVLYHGADPCSHGQAIGPP